MKMLEDVNSFKSYKINVSDGNVGSGYNLTNPKKKQIDIWIFEIKRHRKLLQFQNYLSKEELAIANKFKFQTDKEHYIISHVALRLILSKYLGIKADLLEFKSGSNDKPFLIYKKNNYQFNISKTKELTVIAIGMFDELGVDIEHIESEFDYSEIIANYYNHYEQESIKRSKDNVANTQFFYLWTRKEALVKALGVGLDCDLKEIEVLGRKVSVKSNNLNRASFCLSSFVLNSKYVLSLARKDENVKLHFYNGLNEHEIQLIEKYNTVS